jgi:hypothetical protein
MYWTAILVAVLLSSPPGAGVRGDDSPQAVPAENSQKPATEPAPASGNDQPSSEKKPDKTPSAAKTDESVPPKTTLTPAPTGVRKRRGRAKKPLPPVAESEPRKIVVHRGGTSEPVAQILPGMSPEEANRQRESSEQLLAAAETSLQQLAYRPIDTKKQDTVVQIRQYMDAARAALKDSDPQRAHTLAQKAYLLSDDLVKR